MRVRPLSFAEITEARKVFRNTLPYGQITISDALGAGGAPFTVAIPTFFGAWSYQIYMGASGFINCLTIAPTFIHELTHVWQGSHSFFPPNFMLNSLFHQGMAVVQTGNRNAAYNYTQGAPWGAYNVEQQANIVEDWYRQGMSFFNLLFRYVGGNIQTGHN